MSAFSSSVPSLKSAILPIKKTGLVSKFSFTHVCNSNCHHSKKNSLVIRASNSEESFTEAVAVAPFASQSIAAPAPTGVNSPSAILGAGLVAAAGLVFTANLLAPKKAEAPATPTSYVEPLPMGPYSRLPPPKPPRVFTRNVSKAAAPAIESLDVFFPNSIVDSTFIKACATELFKLGFTKSNCIALVNTCRDEVCRPLVTFIDEEFGLSFNLSGLGGLINSGKTGFKAGMSHSPEFPCDLSGKPRERYVFFAFPHVSVGETGEVGSLLRRGRGKPSSACGALIAIKNTASTPAAEDADDAEFVLLKNKVLASRLCQNTGPAGPDLVTVTKAALDVITQDLEKVVSQVVNPETADYAVITGIQIHSGNQIPGQPFMLERTIDYVSPGTMYAVIQGKKHELKIAATPVLA